MIDTLDSRALRRTDCFGQQFMQAGSYSYNICPAHSHAISGDQPFTITVQEGVKNEKMKQHNVLINRLGSRFDAEPQNLTVGVGDLVLWNCVDANTPPYAIVGDQGFFSSHRMANKCCYSHAFGAAGDYHWKDAFGSAVGGVIKVRDPGCNDEPSFKRWKASLTKGMLIMIADGKPQPTEVEIHTGQTVYFAIEKGAGISITDERILATPSIDPDHCKPLKTPSAKKK